MKYDVIIIGGGLAGLSSALKLSQNGKKVAVFEKHFMAGGYATNFKRKDKDGNLYVFDVSLHGIGGLLPGNAFYNHMKDINMIDKVEVLRKKETGTIYSNGCEIDVPDTFEKYRDHLVNRYSSYKDKIYKLFKEIYSLKEEMESGKPPVIYQKMQDISLYNYLKSFIDDEKFIEEFSFLWLYYGLPPKKLNALFYMLAWISYHIGGTFYIKGGAGKLSDTFVEEIKKNGGEVYLSNEIVKIDIEGNNVTAVHTRRGNKYDAEKFIFACDPNHLINLMDNNNENVIEYKKKLDNNDVGISLSQLYIGLDCKTTEVGITKADYFISNGVNYEDAYKNILEGNYSDNILGLTSYDVLDPDLNKDVGVFVVVFGDHIKNWPQYKSEEYKRKKEEVTNEILENVYKNFPNVKGHIKVLELGTPHTMKRYTNNTQGAVYGWEQNIRQGGFNRLSNKSDFNNVFLSGAWTNPGGGFEGAITGGILTAERILKEDSKIKNNIKVNNNDLSDPDIPLKQFMIGMTANFDNATVSKHENYLLEFIFDDKDIYYIEIKNRKAKLLNKKIDKKSDVIVKTSYKVWYNIAFNGLDGRGAMFDGKLSVLGDADIFMNIPKYFNTSSLGDEPIVKRRKLNTIFWLVLTLIPWIVSGAISRFYNDGIGISLFSILYTALIIVFIKPKQFKEITMLEGLTFISFALYGILYKFAPIVFEAISSYILKIILIGAFFISAIIKKPITSDYSKQSYKYSMTRTKLFTDINIVITLLWAVIFAIQLIISLIISAPWNNLDQILSIVGLIISYYYPKIKLSE